MIKKAHYFYSFCQESSGWLTIDEFLFLHEIEKLAFGKKSLIMYGGRQ